MPDIALCRNIFCPSKGSCYRYKAIPNDYQSYGGFVVLEGEDKCSYYWEDNTKKRIRGKKK